MQLGEGREDAQAKMEFGMCIVRSNMSCKNIVYLTILVFWFGPIRVGPEYETRKDGELCVAFVAGAVWQTLVRSTILEMADIQTDAAVSSPESHAGRVSEALATTSPRSPQGPTAYTHTRIKFEACPLCAQGVFKPIGYATCEQHPLYWAGLDPIIVWTSCAACGHIFTDGYFSKSTLGELFAKSQTHQVRYPNIATALLFVF